MKNREGQTLADLLRLFNEAGQDLNRALQNMDQEAELAARRRQRSILEAPGGLRHHYEGLCAQKAIDAHRDA